MKKRAILDLLLLAKKMRESSNFKPVGLAEIAYDYLKAHPGEWVCAMKNELGFGHQPWYRLRGGPGIEEKREPSPNSRNGRPCLWLRYSPAAVIKEMADPVLLEIQAMQSCLLTLRVQMAEMETHINTLKSIYRGQLE